MVDRREFYGIGRLALEQLIKPRRRSRRDYLNGPAYCANCGADLLNPHSMLVEYWRSEDSIRAYWCYQCHGQGEVVDVGRLTSWEPEE